MGSYSVTVEFNFDDDDSSSSDTAEGLVKASVGVSGEFFSRARRASTVEVAYRIGNPREFALTEDLALRQTNTGPMMCCVGCFGGVFTLAGVLTGIAAWLSTGCIVGLLPVILYIIGGAFAGRYVFFNMVRALRQSRLYVSTESKAHVSEKMGHDISSTQESGRDGVV